MKFTDRDTGDMLVLMITGTVCFAILGTGATVLAIEVLNPSADTRGAAQYVGESISALIALLAGFLAGRSDATRKMQQDIADSHSQEKTIYKSKDEEDPPA